jgi:hypothetical protein
MLSLDNLVKDFAAAFKRLDSLGKAHKTYAPGIGPWGENESVNEAVKLLQKAPSARCNEYASASRRRYPNSKQPCDLVIDGQRALEIKQLRPYNDNGAESEHWTDNLIYPYPGHASARGDCYKVLESAFKEDLAIIVFGFERTPPRFPLETAILAFEIIAREICKLNLSERSQESFRGRMHRHHQQGVVYGWQVYR